jgi:hypothetical protein
VKQECLEPLVFIRYMFEDIKQKDEIESFSKRRLFLAYVVTIDLAHAALVPSQGKLIQVKPGNLPAVRIFDLSLEQAVTASDVCDLPCVRDQNTSQPAEYLKTTPNQKVIYRSDFKPVIRHADFSGSRQIHNVSKGCRLAKSICRLHRDWAPNQ